MAFSAGVPGVGVATLGVVRWAEPLRLGHDSGAAGLFLERTGEGGIVGHGASVAGASDSLRCVVVVAPGQ